MSLPKQLESVYNLFKPRPETCVWGTGDRVYVHWQHSKVILEFWLAGDDMVHMTVTRRDLVKIKPVATPQ